MLRFAQNLHLARCKTPSEYTQYNQDLKNWLGYSEGFVRLKKLAKSCIIQTGNALKRYQNEVRRYDTEKYIRPVSQEPGYFGYRKRRTEKFDEKKASPAQTIILDSLKQCYQDNKANPILRP